MSNNNNSSWSRSFGISKDNKQEKQVQILDKYMIFRQELLFFYYMDNISYNQRLEINQEMVRFINTLLDTKVGHF